MPINESTRKVRERWPLQFDIEGIPRDSTIRKQVLEQLLSADQEQQEMRPTNVFAVDQPQQGQVIDLSKPVNGARYGSPENPHQEYPKMVYDHDSGRVLTVQNKPQEEAAKKRGFKNEPSPRHDYSKVRSGAIAPIKEKGPEREHIMTVEELDAAEAAELAELESEESKQQTEEEADAEIAEQLGEPAPKPRTSKRKK